MLRVAVVGIGSMGCLFAGYLAPHASVTMLGHWSPQLRALERELTLITAEDKHQRLTIDIRSDPTTMPPAEIALILVKSYQSRAASAEIALFLERDGLAVTLQNGLGNDQALATMLGKERVILGSTTEGATLESVGVVRHTGRGETVLQAISGQRSAPLMEFAETLRRAGFRTGFTDNVGEMVWEKLAVNAAINPLTALLEIQNGELLARETTRSAMRQLATEVATVARAMGYNVSAVSAVARAEKVARDTCENRSSMLQDVLNHRRTELEAITGAVLEHAGARGVSAPLNDAVYRLLTAKLGNQNWTARVGELASEQQRLLKAILRERQGVDESHKNDCRNA